MNFDRFGKLGAGYCFMCEEEFPVDDRITKCPRCENRETWKRFEPDIGLCYTTGCDNKVMVENCTLKQNIPESANDDFGPIALNSGGIFCSIDCAKENWAWHTPMSNEEIEDFEGDKPSGFTEDD